MQVLLEDISRTLGACAVTLPGCEDDNISSAAVPQTVRAYDQRQQQQQQHPLRHGFSLMSEHIPVDLSRLSLTNLEDPPAAVPNRMMRGSGASTRAGGRGVGVGRGLRNVSTSSYRTGPHPLMTHTGGMERQFA
jgi:hypothetical protein